MKITSCLLFAAALILCGLAWREWLHPSLGGGWINLHSLDVALYLWPGVACGVLGLLPLWPSRYSGTNSIFMWVTKWAGIVISSIAVVAAIWILFLSVRTDALGNLASPSKTT